MVESTDSALQQLNHYSNDPGTGPNPQVRLVILWRLRQKICFRIQNKGGCFN